MNERQKERKEPTDWDTTKAWEEDLRGEDMPLMRELIDLLCEITPEETVESIRYLEAKRNAVMNEKDPPSLPEGEAAQMFIELCEWMLDGRRKDGEEKEAVTRPSDDRERSARTDSRRSTPPSNQPPLR